MKIQELLEAKKPARLMYTGTSSQFLRSILKNGIVPNPKKRTWQHDRDTSKDHESLVSLPGSYWTSSYGTASMSAGDTCNRFGGEKMIVIARIQTQSAKADEDSITGIVKRAYVKALGFDPSFLPDILVKLYYDDRERYNDLKKQFLEAAHEYLTDNKSKPVPKRLLSDLFDTRTLRIIAYVSDDQELFRYLVHKPKSLPDRDEFEQKLLHMKDQLTSYYRESAENDMLSSHTLRITEPVKYRGANRIINIVIIPDFGSTKPEPLEIMYGPEELPERFIQGYKDLMGYFPGAKKLRFNT